jgi:parallel beta-helix repeat protein
MRPTDVLTPCLIAPLFACGGAPPGAPGETADSTEALAAPAALGCGAVLGAPGTYVLGHDLDCRGDAITITAKDVTLDLGGYAVTSADGLGKGVAVAGRIGNHPAGVVVKHGAVSGFTYGVYVDFAAANVSGVTASANGTGIYVTGESMLTTTVSSCTLDGNGFGITGGRSTTVRVTGVTVSKTTQSAILIAEGTLDVAGATITGGGNGVFFNRANGSITGSTVDGTAGIGISSYEALLTVTGNQVHGNAQGGIHLNSLGERALVESNTVTENGSTDMFDRSPTCANDTWKNNTFETRNVTCIH